MDKVSDSCLNAFNRIANDLGERRNGKRQF